MNPILRLINLPAAIGAGLATLLPGAMAQPAQVAHATHGATTGGMAAERGPLRSVHAHVSGFHFYSGDLRRALRAEHYCSHLNAEVFQCIIYDSDREDARLIGIEYIISEALFRQLPPEEKQLWHSHRYEVMSGLLVAPGRPAGEELALMTELATTYGKTWHLWQVDRGDKIPLGLPKLMMGYTADGQADPEMVAARDRELNLKPEKIKARRVDIPTRPVAEGADGWEHGPAFQISDTLLRPAPAAPTL